MQPEARRLNGTLHYLTRRPSAGPAMERERLESLPVHSVPAQAASRRDSALRVVGLVARALTLASADLAHLPRQEVQADFSCEEGWTVQGLRWRGVRLPDVIAMAGPLARAAHVRVAAGGYAVPMSLADGRGALLCDELEGKPLEERHGGPWRMLWNGRECFTSVRWVGRLELASDPDQEGPAAMISLDRSRRRRSAGPRNRRRGSSRSGPIRSSSGLAPH
ncbi:MAG: molybdopterin-dependent oxidoreductase [Candidatus Dormibacterales bacterium]